LAQKGRGFLALLGAAHSLNHSLFLIGPPLLLIIMQDLNTSKFMLGTIGFVASMIYGTGSLVGGPLSDKISETKIIALALALAGASTFVLLFASNLLIYSLALFIMAAWASLYHATANSLISRAYDKQMGEAMGIHGAGGTLGVMLTPIIAFSIGVAFDWRMSFIVFGVLSILIGIIISRNRLQTTRTESKLGIREIFRIEGLLTILTFNILVGLYMKGIELFLPTYLTLKPLQPLTQQTAEFWAATAATLVLACGVVGQWLGGRAADRVGSKKVLVTVSVGITVALLFLLLTPAAFAFLGVAAFIVLYGLSFYGHQPALNALTGIMTPVERRGAVYGIFFFTSFGLGSLSQAITGYLMDHYPNNPEYSFVLLTIIAATALILSTLIPSKRQNKTSSSTLEATAQ